MSDRISPPQPRFPSQLLIVDEDPVFRLGLKIWLEPFTDLAVVAEADSGIAALEWLASRLAPNPAATEGIDLVILDLGLGRSHPSQLQGLTLCQQIRAQYPALPILLLSAATEPVLLAAAQQAGASGYCPKSADVAALTTAIRQVAAGEAYWVLPAGSEPTTGQSIQPSESQQTSPLTRQATVENLPAPVVKVPNPITVFLRNQRLLGLRQIDRAIVDVATQLQNLDLSDLDRAILAGRYRELRVSRWLVNRLLAPSNLKESPPVSPSPKTTQPSNGDAGAIQPVSVAPVQITDAALTAQNLQAVLFDAVLAKLQTSLENQTDVPLETDILRSDRKRELFYLVLRKLEDVLSELRYSQVELDQLIEKRSLILQDLWQTTLIDFFGKYYTVPVGELQIEVVSVLQQDAETVEIAILDRIPFVIDLFNHLLFQTPLLVDSTPYPAGNPEALARAELILDNLVIQVANGVVQPLLNRFANVEVIKQTFYDRRLLSIRDIERFRNDLSWRYRMTRLFGDPKDIFESQYQLFTFSGRGIKQRSVYAPRTQELAQLSGFPYAVTIALETRDAIAPRLRSAISLIGNSVIYVLTEVIGRGIGLIGRGIIKGIGNVWQDSQR